ncbi:MAG: hypothetical protein ACOH14_06335 [Rhodoglobus sp.]
MSDVSITELIAEARAKFKDSPGFELGILPGSALDIVRRLADALERVTVPSENERDVLARIVGGAVYGDRTNPSRATEAVDEALAYGFRLPVPVEMSAEEANSAARPRIDLNAARSVLEQWDDADELLAFAATNWQLLRANYRALLEAAVAVPVEPEWEYGCRLYGHHDAAALGLGFDSDDVFTSNFGVPFSSSAMARIAGQQYSDVVEVVRRRADAEWQTVEVCRVVGVS